MYLDESGIKKFLYKQYARAERGKQVFADIKGSKFARINMIAAQCGKKIIAPAVCSCNVNTDVFNAYLKEFLVKELKPGQIVIMDNYSIHRGKETKKIIEKAGCVLKFQPKYSPDLNPIENSWAVIKAIFRKMLKRFDDFNDAIDATFRLV